MFKNLFRRNASPTFTRATFAAGDLEGFWQWFLANAILLRKATADRENGFPASLLDDFQNALGRIDPGLAFEFGIDADGLHETIISAEGVSALFPNVLALTSAAPTIPGHRITAFRPRQPGFSLRIDGHEIAPADVSHFAWQEADDVRLNVVVYLPLPSDTPHDSLRMFGYLLLDSVIGEYDVATTLGRLDFLPKSSMGERPVRPLTVLVADVDRIIASRATN